MSRISNTGAYANINPTLTDYFVLTDKENNLATKTCTVKSLQTLFGLSTSQVSVAVPADNLYFLQSSPFELIASPGAGFALFIKDMVCFMDAGATAFDFANTGAIPKIGVLPFNTITQAVLNSATDVVFNIGGTSDTQILPSATALNLTAAANTATTGGRGTLYFNITYQTLKLASTF